MKNSLHASLRASGLDSFGYQNHYHFPPVHNSDFWREPLREEYSMGSRNRNNRRPLTLPELTAVGQPLRATVYANPHTRVRGYDKNKKSQSTNGETTNGKSPEEPSEDPRFIPICTDKDSLSKPVTAGKSNESPFSTYPELKIVVTKIIPHGNVSSPGGDAKSRARRSQRKHSDHT
ncbi:jg24034 [Pararge aegeria aegeria]|nr:jg24034 [Pararge aegeria aegeria]